MWNSQSSTWVSSYHEIFTYDTNNNPLTDTYGYWNGTAWQEGLKYEYAYDSNNNLISSTTSGQGNYNGQNIYTYDSNNNQLSDTYNNWNGTSWVISSVQTNTCDTMNNLIHYLFQLSNGSTLDDYLKYDAAFNASNNITDFRSYILKSGNWVPNGKGYYSYDADNNLTLYADSASRDGGGTWRLYSFERYAWTSEVTGVENINNSLPSTFNLSQNYPNPFNPSTTIEFNIPKQLYVTLKIYDLLVKKLQLL